MRPKFYPPPHVTLTLVGPSAGRAARLAILELFAGSAISAWHADAELAVGELVANAIAECGECQVSAWFAEREKVLRVEVSDGSSNMPNPQPVDSTQIGGHGLRIVEALTTRWGVSPHASGKTVWIEIDG